MPSNFWFVAFRSLIRISNLTWATVAAWNAAVTALVLSSLASRFFWFSL